MVYLPWIFIFLNYLHKQTLLDNPWRSIKNKYEHLVFDKGFDALSLILPSDIVSYASGDSLAWGKPWWIVKHVSRLLTMNYLFISSISN